MGRDIGHVQGDAGRPQVPLSLSPVFLCCMHRCCRLRPLHGQRGRGADSGGERRRRPLLTQFTTPKQGPDQQRQILARRHHARFLQRESLSKRQQRQAVECGNGLAAQEARGPQVTAFCQALRVYPSAGERRSCPRRLQICYSIKTVAAITTRIAPANFGSTTGQRRPTRLPCARTNM